MTFTYQNMQDRIADELTRSDLGSQTQNAIQSAIAEYQRRLFYFNEKAYGTWPTVLGQEFYGASDNVPADIVAIDTLTVIYASVRLPVARRSWERIEEMQTGAFKGIPTDYAYFGQQFRLFPIPSSVVTLSLAYRQRVAAPVLSTDVGPWMNDAEELIRSAAKRRIFQHVLHIAEDAALMREAEGEALQALVDETARRIGTGYVRATQF